jgi:outer membrane protein TolC
VRQNLSRNRLAREIELLEDIAYAKGIEPQFMAKIKLQDLQTTCEKLYWQITALNEQIALSERLVATSQKFAKSMQERLRLGRADDVDVAEAESLVKTHESQRLDLEIQRDQLYQRLRIHVYGFSRQRVLRTPRQLPKTSRPLPAQSAAPALTLAVKRRYDLKMFAEQIKATSSQIELAQEQGAPDIGLFAAYRKRGIGGDLSESTEDMPDGTVTSVGIDVSWMIGQTESDSKAQAARIRQKSLNMQRQRLAEMVARNLHASFEAWRGAQRQRQLAENHIAILKNKRRAEQRKVNQARSDEVAVLRYEIEVLSARLKRVRAQLNVMIAGADIRGLLHTYPDEPKLATAR